MAPGSRCWAPPRREAEAPREEESRVVDEADHFDLPEEEKLPPEPKREERAAKPKEKRAAREHRGEHSGRTAGKVKATKGGRQGRLYGWLVSYSNPDGEAVELREGKFFVSASSLKENDLVLDHDSVSTPHAMITISADRGLEVQDLMSENGIHVRPRDEDAYRQEEEVVTVEHGDWLRFGDVEFLVTLIAHVGKV